MLFFISTRPFFFFAFFVFLILKGHSKDCFKINGKQRITMPKKGEYVKFRNYGRKIKSSFMINAEFEIILVSEGNGKQNPEQFYTSKYQKHITCSYGYKLVCIHGRFSKSFKTYLGKDAVYISINNMIEESKYCSDVMKNHFNKNLG